MILLKTREEIEHFVLNAIENKKMDVQMEQLIQAQKKAEEIEDWELMYWISMHLSSASCEAGKYEVFFSTFFWCLEFYDMNEFLLSEQEREDIMWHYKWVLEHLDKYPYVSKVEIEKTFLDFEKRCERYGYSLRTYYQYRHLYYRRIGEKQKAEKYFFKWINAYRDSLSECEACEESLKMDYFFEIGENEKAFQIATWIANEDNTCPSILENTYSKLLLPYYRLGHLEKAKDFQRKGYFLHYGKNRFVTEVSEHIFYLSLVDIDKAYNVYNKHVPLVNQTLNAYDKFHFGLASWFMFKKAEQHKYHVDHQLENVEKMVKKLANVFDERNETNAFHQKINAMHRYL